MNPSEVALQFNVTSSFIRSISFGRITLGTDAGGITTPVIWVQFTGGADYLYLNVPYSVHSNLLSACEFNQVNPEYSVGRVFNEELRHCTSFARLHDAPDSLR